MAKYMLKKDTHDHRDLLFHKVETFLGITVPKSVDLRPKMPPIYDQGQLGSCTANAIACGLKEYDLLQSGDHTHLSRLFLYWQERNMEGTVGEDAGAMIRDGMKVLKHIGVCPEADFPYNIGTFTNTPTEQADTDAGKYKISMYYRVHNLHALKLALAHGNPVVFGLTVYESFESDEVARTGRVPIPNPQTEQCLGGHAILAVGYDDDTQLVIVRNSWGPQWGDKGYCYIPYAVFEDSNLVTDMWCGR